MKKSEILRLSFNENWRRMNEWKISRQPIKTVATFPHEWFVPMKTNWDIFPQINLSKQKGEDMSLWVNPCNTNLLRHFSMNESLRSFDLWRGQLDSSSFPICQFESQNFWTTEGLPEFKLRIQNYFQSRRRIGFRSPSWF